jgi:hypothetical protein
MSAPIATYAFMPWLRRGIGADIGRVDGTAGSTPRSTVSVAVRFNSDDAKTGAVDLSLFGPGDVKALDARTVTRTWPRPGVMDAEPNYFPLLEFDQADLPWRYTPARATSGDRLTPWVALIVVADAEVDKLTPPRGGALGIVNLKDAGVLPKWSQLWAWAHVQYSGGPTIDAATAGQLLLAGSPLLISRLLCPRRLKPKTAYTALLVPTFQRGALAGLGQPVLDTIDALSPAWTDTATGALSLPVYYSFRFGTGLTGDFEALARLLQRFEAPASIGTRDMDVTAPSPGLPAAATVPLALQGMLRALDTQETPWPSAERQSWIAAVEPLLNLPAERQATPGLPRTVAPPLYGQWPAAADRVDAGNPAARPVWFQALGVDPRLRVGAGLGTQVVQVKQESLMASAWDQVDRVRQLNEELRQAQLAREIARRVEQRHVMVADPQAVLMVTAPLHARVTASPTTIRSVLERSAIPRGIFEGAFRRVARPLGPVGRRQGRASAPARTDLLTRLNRGDLSAAKTPPLPSGMATPGRLGGGLAPGETAGSVAARARRALWLAILALILVVLAVLLAVAGASPFAFIAVAAAGAAAVAWRKLAQQARADSIAVALRDGALTPQAIAGVTPAEGFVPQPAPSTGVPRTLPGPPAPGNAVIPDAATAFRDSMARLFERMAPPDAPLSVAQPVALAALRTTLVEKLDPRVTFASAYRQRFALGASVFWKPDDPIEPIHAAPEFPQPMYEELKRLSSDWILPGFSRIPVNTVTLLRTNQTMVESFMVGLNHEMTRELLWREYPVEQRATYFRQFWDARGAVAPPGQTLDPKTLEDITPVHTWPKPSSLGTHSPRPVTPGGSDYLVFFIRGDLLRRYPNTVVYAARAKWLSNGLRDIDDPAPDATPAEISQKQSWPLFAGALDPDANFFGFALTKEQVRGAPDAKGDPGWFFILQEHSHEPRFGLDESDASTLGRPVVGATWDNLSWGSLAADAAALDGLVAVDLDTDLPDTRQVSSSSTQAWHANRGLGHAGSRASDLAFITFQRPMRVGIHGADMVP